VDKRTIAMLSSIVRNWNSVNRRQMFRQGGLLTLLGAVRPAAVFAAATPAAPAPAKSFEAGGAIYRAIGVRPLVNARGTFTIITGSETLPSVKEAMDEASRSFVQMDELMEGVGKRLAEVTGAPWGIVTAGCCAALTHCTSASIAGTNPERMQRLPDLTGLKNEVIIPEYSRNVYDHAIRMVGTTIITVHNTDELEKAFNDRTAMSYILAGPGDEGPLGTEVVAEACKRHNVPLIVDAAAEILTMPNVHLKRGATAVAYSGGKCIRGPQAAGLLLGDKNLLQAAWLNSAPHHAFGRSLKVGKEEIMGMLAAVEAWTKRDYDGEMKLWESWLDGIATNLKKISGVTTQIEPPEGLSNRTPILRIAWDGAQLGITGEDVRAHLLDTEPRIVLGSAHGKRPDQMASGVSITPYMLMPGDDKIVSDRLHQVLSKPPHLDPLPEVPQGDPVSVAGQWQLEMQFDRGNATHNLIFEQSGADLVGTHYGEYGSGDLQGKMHATQIAFRSSQRIGGQILNYEFSGAVDGDKMGGDVSLGEYGAARWTAQRHQYHVPGGVVRPVKRS
jgi:D-glucosaminate-6-phosphate ammonia-lyase